jgi:hypothetical protein
MPDYISSIKPEMTGGGGAPVEMGPDKRQCVVSSLCAGRWAWRFPLEPPTPRCVAISR